MTTELTAYVPRLLLHWEERYGAVRHRTIDGTLVFADVSGFTALSEKLHRLGGKVGAEQMAEVISGLFSDLLGLAAIRGGEMLKYGGDAILLFFEGEGHAPRAAAAALEMQRRLREIGRVDTGAGFVRLRMSVGMHSGAFDFFVAGQRHQELVVAGPDTTITVEMESAADATEVLASPATCELVGEGCLGAEKAGGRLLRRVPAGAGRITTQPLAGGLRAQPFLAEALVDHLSADDEPDHRLAAVAFLHIMGMDAMIDAGRAGEASDRLDSTMTLIQDAFVEFGVTFLATDLYEDGTKVMAAAGAPVAHADPEERLLRASRRILDASPPLPVRIGINRGHVFAGAVGPSFRRTYTTMGDVTNTAARVMAKAAPGQCLVLQPVLDGARSSWAYEAQEAFAAKGKTEPLQPLAVTSEETAGGSTHRLRSTAFVGREREIERLRELWTAASGGEGVALEIEGEAGVGKSTLLDELVDMAGDGHSFRTVCSPYEEAMPYRSAQRIFTSLLGTTVAELQSIVSASAPQLMDWVPLLALLLGEIVKPTPAIEAVDPQQRTSRLHQVTIELLDARFHEPLLLVVEDADRMDESTRGLLRALATAATSRRWMIVAARRPDGTTVFDGGQVLVLEPLDPDAVLQLIRASSPRAILPEDAGRLLERSGGNPLFLSQLMRSDGTELPDTVEALFAGRIDTLDPPLRRVIRAAAVLGQTFTLDVLADVLDESLPTSLWSTEAAGLLEVTSTSGSFRHGLVRDVAYEALTYRRRRELHARVAQRLLHEPEPEPELLAVHFDAAGAGPEACAWSLTAAQRAKDSMAHSTAASFFSRAARAARQVDSIDDVTLSCIHRAHGEAAVFAGRLQEAKTAFARARRLLSRTTSPAPLAELHFLEGLLREHLGDRRAALRWFGSSVRLLDGCDRWWDRPSFLPGQYQDPALLRTRILLSRGLNRYRSGRLHPARVDALDALATTRANGDVAGEAHALGLLHLVHAELREPTPEPYAERAIELFRQIDDQKELANVLNNVGMDLHLRGEWDAAASYYEQSQRAQQAAGHVVFAAAVANNRAEILLDQGHLGQARVLLEEAVQTFDAAGHWFAVAALVNLATAHGRGRSFTEAYRLLDDAGARAERLRAAAYVVEVHLRRAEVALLAGDTELTERSLQSAGEGVGTSLRGRRTEALLAAMRGDTDRACDLLGAVADDALAAGERYERLLALEARDRVRPTAPATSSESERNELTRLLGVVDLGAALPDLIER